MRNGFLWMIPKRRLAVRMLRLRVTPTGTVIRIIAARQKVRARRTRVTGQIPVSHLGSSSPERTSSAHDVGCDGRAGTTFTTADAYRPQRSWTEVDGSG